MKKSDMTNYMGETGLQDRNRDPRHSSLPSIIRKAWLSLGLCAALGLCGCSSQGGGAGSAGGSTPAGAGTPADTGALTDGNALAGIKKLSGFSAQGENGALSNGKTDQNGSHGDKPITQGGASPADASTVTDFALRLFRETLSSEQSKATGDAGKNILVSPASVLFALSMTANGADNNTLAQMEEALGASVTSLNSYLQEYRTSLPEGDGYKLNIANSIWFKDDPDFTVNQDFLTANGTWYDADIYQAPFDASTLKSINKWVSDSTDGMIPGILDSIPKDAIMYLINGIAFDAEWSSIYREYQIHEADFTEEDGTVCRTEFMYADEYAYLQDDNAQGFLKYYKDRKYAFAALLPNEGISVSEYVKSLDGAALREMLSNPVSVPVKTAIPKFEAEYSVEMSEIFRNLGMTDAFDGGLADFSRLGGYTDENLFINRILHKTYIAVDERGTKAGAATAVEMQKTSAAIPLNEKEVYLNRPFVYLIIDCEENVPIFIGTLMSVK